MNTKRVKRESYICIFDNIPDEIIYHIFTFINFKDQNWLSILLVCKRFRFIGEIAFSPASNDNIILCTACKKGNLNSVRLLLNDPRINPSLVRNNPFFISIQAGNLDVVKALLRDKRIDPCKDTLNPFFYITDKNRHDIAIQLIDDPRVNSGYISNLAFRWAITKQEWMLAEELLKREKIKRSIDPLDYYISYNVPTNIQSMLVDCILYGL